MFMAKGSFQAIHSFFHSSSSSDFSTHSRWLTIYLPTLCILYEFISTSVLPFLPIPCQYLTSPWTSSLCFRRLIFMSSMFFRIQIRSSYIPWRILPSCLYWSEGQPNFLNGSHIILQILTRSFWAECFSPNYCNVVLRLLLWFGALGFLIIRGLIELLWLCKSILFVDFDLLRLPFKFEAVFILVRFLKTFNSYFSTVTSCLSLSFYLINSTYPFGSLQDFTTRYNSCRRLLYFSSSSNKIWY